MSFADEIPVEYLWCKDTQHAWDADSQVTRQVFNRRLEKWEIWRTMRCDRCGTHKTQKMTKACQLLRTDYDYPDDYHVAGASPYRMTAADRAKIRARSIALRGGVEKTPKPKKVPARKKSA